MTDREREKNRVSQNTAETMRPVTEPMLKEKRAEVSVTLTDAEREAVEHFAREFRGPNAATLRGLLERLK